MNIAALLSKAALTFPANAAVSLGDTVVQDYATLAARASRLARALTERLGFKPGETVAMVMTNRPAYQEVLYGIWHAGLVAVPINAKLHPKEVAWILDNAEARACFVSPDLADDIAPLTATIERLRHVIVSDSAEYAALFAGESAALYDRGSPDDIAWLFYTSGTTGRPKGAMLSHRNLLAATVNYFADVDSIEPGDCIVHAAPMSHGSGLYGLPHVAKAANQVIPESGGFDPAETLALIARWPGTSIFFAPTMVHRLIESPVLADADTRNLKAIIYGGGPMYVADLLAALKALGPKLVQIYGQGEAPMTITGLPKRMHVDSGHPRYLERLGSAGIARTDVEVMVADADDKPLPAGEIGEILARGDVVMRGYWRNPQATAETLRNGWLHTGDMGSFDSDGFLTLKDRSKDMIISGGSNIYPREIEEVLLRHPEVAEVSVVGQPHQDWGEEVVAFVVARGQVDAAALDRLCLEHIARFKRPKHYRFVTALPKNNYGKVLKTELRKLLQSA
ncbi:MAG TPA: AMP-binding protein [Candidatus Cybelea sp.]|nr:AMP-binding protein [Candidatus Cybelea sp.]